MSEPTPSGSPQRPEDPARPVGSSPGPERFKELWVEGADGRVRPVDQTSPAPSPGPGDDSPASSDGRTRRARWYEVRALDDFVAAATTLGLGREAARWLGPLAGRVKHPLAHVEHVGTEWLLVVTPTVSYSEDDRQVSTGAFHLLVGPDVVVTFEKGSAGIHERMREHLTGPAPARGSGATRVAQEALFSLVSAASDVELGLGDAVAQVEKLVFAPRRDVDPVLPVYDLKREITEARRALLPITAELPELVADRSRSHVTFDKRLMDRLTQTVERIDRHLDAHDDLLSDMLSVHLSQVSVRQNEDMRKISAWAAILVFPTIVGGIYGMNFDDIPELHWTFGYPIALGIMAVGCLVLYRAFKRVGWL